MTDKDFKEIEKILRRSLDILSKNLQQKFNMIFDGQQMLAEKMEMIEERLGRKIDAVARVHVSPPGRYRDSQRLHSF